MVHQEKGLARNIGGVTLAIDQAGVREIKTGKSLR
jgi:hypothetical protein